jgi:excisionase family DNA binding protein
MDNMMTLVDAAKFAHVRRETIWRWVNQKKLTGYKRKDLKGIRVDKEELEEFLKFHPID